MMDSLAVTLLGPSVDRGKSAMHDSAQGAAGLCPPPVRLLLIEDNTTLAEMTAEFIREAGVDVRVAECGETGLQAAASYHPQIVLCDLSLPDMSGLDVARALRLIPGARDALLAIHTGMEDADVRIFEKNVD